MRANFRKLGVIIMLEHTSRQPGPTIKSVMTPDPAHALPGKVTLPVACKDGDNLTRQFHAVVMPHFYANILAV